MKDPRSIGVATIATNRYVDYWKRLATSADKYLFPGKEVVMHVFTDQPSAVLEHSLSLDRIKVNPVRIESLVWPEATLFRYKIFSENKSVLEQDVLMHLDADMLIVRDFGGELDPQSWPNGIALVRHPGYSRPTGFTRLTLNTKHPGLAVRDINSLIRFGGIGRWETRSASLAFVPRSRRRVYVCGGTWFARRDAFIRLNSELSERTSRDLDRGLTAVWHDESHLNWFASQHQTELLSSSYCFAENMHWISATQPTIMAVDKNDERTR